MTGIKPFELSLWGDRLDNNNQFEEYRVCTVASDIMDDSVGAFDVKLVTKINGDNQLTFSMYYQFIDTVTGEVVRNEIAELLHNEAKLKLHYDNKWYDFVIKDVKKDSSKYSYNFTAKDANIQELSKNGYNLSLTEVQSNNVGTVTELGNTVLADTDWVISEDSDKLYETTEELVLLANTVGIISVKKLTVDEQTGAIVESQLEISNNKSVYVFYSNLENKNTRVQFLYKDFGSNEWNDPNTEDGVIKDNTWVECYYDISSAQYSKHHNTLGIDYPSFLIIQENVELGLKAKKHVYNVFNQYSPTLERYVYKYIQEKDLPLVDGYIHEFNLTLAKKTDSYHWAWYAKDFATLTESWSYYANSDNLPLMLECDCNFTWTGEKEWKAISIWFGGGGQSSDSSAPYYNNNQWEFFSSGSITGTQYQPEVQVEDGIYSAKIHYKGVIDNFINNKLSGNQSNKVRFRVNVFNKNDENFSEDQSINLTLSNFKLTQASQILARDFSTKRDIPVLYQDICTGGRNIKSLDGWSVTTAEKDSLSNEYEYDTTEGTQSYLRWTKRSGNILCNSGIFDNRKYIGTIVADQEWLVEVIYKYGPSASGFKPQFITKTSTPITLNATEISSTLDGGWITTLWKIVTSNGTWPIISEREFNLDEKVQLQFVQSTDNNYVDIKKCSLFRSMGQDEDGNYYTPDNISKLINTEDKTTYYYYNWEDVIGDNRITDKSELELQAQVDSTSDSVETYIPVYTCEKTRAVTIEKSNYFNAIQSICESFKCWADFDIQRDENGKITNKQIIFKEYINHPNYAGFKYGLNLSGITRTIKSDQIVTKLLVQPNNNEFAPNKVCTIQQAGANPTADTFIYDMRYYVNKKMLDALKWDDDLYVTEWEEDDSTDAELARNNGAVKGYYPALKYYNKKLLSISDALATASGALSEAEGRLSIAENGKKSAEDTLVKKLPEAIQKIPKTIKIDDDSSRDVWLLGSGQSQMDWAWNNANHTQVKNNTSSGDSYSKGTNEVWRIAIKHAPKDGSYGLTDIGLTVNETFVTDATDKLSGCGLDGITLTSGEKYIYGAFFRCENQKERYKYYLALTSVTQNLEAINDGEWHFYSTEETASNSGARLFIGTYPYEDKAGDRNLPVSFMCPILLLKEDWNTYISPLLKSRDYYINELPKAQEEVNKINERIKSLKLQYNDILKKKLALNKSFFTKYKRFIQEGTWSNDKCMDPNLYYNDALVTLSNSSLPKVSYDIKVTDISGLEEYSDFHYRVGDETTIQDPDFFGWELDDNLQPTNIPKRETIIVSEATYNLQNPSKNTLKVQTYKTQFNDLFNQITASVQSVTYAQGGFERAAEFMRAVDEEKSQFITNALNNAAAVIQHGSTVTTDNTGIRLQDSIESNKMVHLAGGGILLSNDGGKTWRTGITADGIAADVITSGVVNTGVLRIMNGNDSTFMWNSYGLTAYDFESQGNRIINVNYNKGVRFNRFGIYGTNNLVNESNETTESLNNIVNNSIFALTWDGLKVSGNNGAIIKIGKQYTNNDTLSSIFEVKKGDDVRFRIDANGNVYIGGSATIGSSSTQLNSIIDNNSIFSTWIAPNSTFINGAAIATGTVMAGIVRVYENDTQQNIIFEADGNNHSVRMSGWEVNRGWLLYRGANGWGADGSMLLANGSRATGSKAFGGSGARTDWTITSGSKFGVTTGGELFATSAHLQGEIIIAKARPQILRATNEWTAMLQMVRAQSSSLAGVWTELTGQTTRTWRMSGTKLDTINNNNTFYTDESQAILRNIYKIITITDSPVQTIKYGWEINDDQLATIAQDFSTSTQILIKKNIKYTMSCYARVKESANSNTKLYMAWYKDNSNSGSNQLAITTSWQRYSFSFTPTVDNPNIYFGRPNNSVAYTIQICAMKLEEGDGATAWCEYEPDEYRFAPPQLLNGTNTTYESNISYGNVSANDQYWSQLNRAFWNANRVNDDYKFEYLNFSAITGNARCPDSNILHGWKITSKQNITWTGTKGFMNQNNIKPLYSGGYFTISYWARPVNQGNTYCTINTQFYYKYTDNTQGTWYENIPLISTEWEHYYRIVKVTFNTTKTISDFNFSIGPEWKGTGGGIGCGVEIAGMQIVPGIDFSHWHEYQLMTQNSSGIWQASTTANPLPPTNSGAITYTKITDQTLTTQQINTSVLYVYDTSRNLLLGANGSVSNPSVTIAGWKVDKNSLYSGTAGQDNSAKISTANFSGRFAGQEDLINNWRMTIGSKFGVTSDGTVYATGANLSGEIKATSGIIGDWEIKESGISTCKKSTNYKEFTIVQGENKFLLGNVAADYVMGQLSSGGEWIRLSSLSWSNIVQNDGPSSIEPEYKYYLALNHFIESGSSMIGVKIRVYTASGTTINPQEFRYLTPDLYSGNIDIGSIKIRPYERTTSVVPETSWDIIKTLALAEIASPGIYLPSGSFVGIGIGNPFGGYIFGGVSSVGFEFSNEFSFQRLNTDYYGIVTFKGSELSPESSFSYLGRDNKKWGSIYGYDVIIGDVSSGSNYNVQHSGYSGPTTWGRGSLTLNGNAFGLAGGWWETSDYKVKNTIQFPDNRYDHFFDLLAPIKYKFNYGQSNRIHLGLIAQDVKTALLNSGLSTTEYACYADYEKPLGDATCGIRYEELIPLCIDQIQRLKARVAELETRQGITYSYIEKSDYHMLDQELQAQLDAEIKQQNSTGEEI